MSSLHVNNRRIYYGLGTMLAITLTLTLGCVYASDMQWQCPICLKNYSIETLVIDPFFNRITNAVSTTSSSDPVSLVISSPMLYSFSCKLCKLDCSVELVLSIQHMSTLGGFKFLIFLVCTVEWQRILHFHIWICEFTDRCFTFSSHSKKLNVS